MGKSIKIGSICLLKDDIWCRYGVVTKKERIYRSSSGKKEDAFTVSYISPQTGLKVRCADSRCCEKDTCPGCGSLRRRDGLVLISDKDLKDFLEDGLISQELFDSCPKSGSEDTKRRKK